MPGYKFLFSFILVIYSLKANCYANSSLSTTVEIDLRPYLEVLDPKWNSKNLSEISNSTDWINAYSDAGKSKIIFQGNWYRLQIGSWLKDGNWVLVHPLAAHFELYRNEGGQLSKSEHGYRFSGPNRITYRKTAVFLDSVISGEWLYFKISGMSKRSSHHPVIQSPNTFFKMISRESPLNAFFYCAIFFVSLISLFAYFMLKEKIYFNYAMYLFASLGVFLGIQGYVFQYTTQWTPGYSIAFFGLVNLFTILFVYDLFGSKSRIQLILTYLIAGISLLFSCFSLLGLSALAFDGLYSVVIGTQFIIIFSCLLNALKHKKNRLILIFISLSFLVSTLGLINDRIYVPFTDLIDAAYQPFSLIEILLFGFILLKRFYYINIEKQQAIELARVKTLENVKLEAEKEKLSVNVKIGMLAAQVSHDIRSPLSALTLLAGSLSEIPEDKRILVRSAINRITDIANNLLEKSKVQNFVYNTDSSEFLNLKSNSTDQQRQLILLPALIDTLISEKRIQFRVSPYLQIQAHFENTYGYFVNVVPSELSRILSNAINNSVEAFESGQIGIVDVTLENNDIDIIIKINDNGKGIPKHILAKIGNIGVTFGKEGTGSGNGLGVSHAKQAIESFGGSYKIESTEGIGTTIIMTLPRAQAPSWFVQDLVVSENQTVVAVDDDNSILEIWKQKFNSLVEKNKISLITFTSGTQLREWVKQNVSKLPTSLYLIDFEFLGQSANGLTLIEELKIASQSILVTSRYEERSILDNCTKLGVRLIPKGMAPMVSIKMESQKKKIDVCLLDNDELVHSCWKMSAELKDKTFIGFINHLDFLEYSPCLDRATKIFIDSNLGNGINGEEISKRIFDLGFKNIYLCTGYQASQFPPMPWIREIIGKDPNF
jgi:signal transduction histidine kinase